MIVAKLIRSIIYPRENLREIANIFTEIFSYEHFYKYIRVCVKSADNYFTLGRNCPPLMRNDLSLVSEILCVHSVNRSADKIGIFLVMAAELKRFFQLSWEHNKLKQSTEMCHHFKILYSIVNYSCSDLVFSFFSCYILHFLLIRIAVSGDMLTTTQISIFVAN